MFSLRAVALALMLTTLASSGCSDDSGRSNTPDTVGTDTSTADSGADLAAECQSDSDCNTDVQCARSVCDGGRCVLEDADDGSACDSGEPCTRGICAAGDCTGGDLEPGWCRIDGACVANGETNPTNSCQECVAATATDTWSADDTNDCDDGVACTVDSCVGGVCAGAPSDDACDDGNPCTADRCDGEAGCGFDVMEDGESCGAGLSADHFCWTGGRCVDPEVAEYGTRRVNHLRFAPDGPLPDDLMLAVASTQDFAVWNVPTMAETPLAVGAWQGVVWRPDRQSIVSQGASPSLGTRLLDPTTPNAASEFMAGAYTPLEMLGAGRALSNTLWASWERTMPCVVDLSAGTPACLDAQANLTLSNDYTWAWSSRAGDLLAVTWSDLNSATVDKTELRRTADLSVVKTLDTLGKALFVPGDTHVVYFNEAEGRFETLELSSGLVAHLPVPVVGGANFLLQPSGGFDVMPYGDSILAYDQSRVDEVTHVVLLRWTDGAFHVLDEFTVKGASARPPSESRLVAPTGQYAALPFTASAATGFRLYTHKALWAPLCTSDASCAADAFCDLTWGACQASPCKDGQDNDGDALVDAADPDCALGQLELRVD